MKKVYLCMGTDIVHVGHTNLIKNAATLGEVTVGVLTDEVMASYKHYPIVSFEERVEFISNLKHVTNVVPQKTLEYNDILREIKPDYVVHGDNWLVGNLSEVREEVINILKEWGGELVEFPYTHSESVDMIEKTISERLQVPEVRRTRLRRLISIKKPVSVIEAHSGITGLIAEKTSVSKNGKTFQFDAIWSSSLCDSTSMGKPDIELLDTTCRLRKIEEILEVTTKPIIVDADTGGQIEHFCFYVKTLERMGVSAVVIEDKTGLKKNSLFGTEVEQTQDTIENFCNKIKAAKRSTRTKDFMIIARIESLILEKGESDALTRAFSYVKAGADAIVIHSRQKTPDEVFSFCKAFRDKDKITPIVVIPTSFNSVTEDEFGAMGINVVIYANQFIRSGIAAMQSVAESILTNKRSLEVDEICLSIKEIITLIPEN